MKYIENAGREVSPTEAFKEVVDFVRHILGENIPCNASQWSCSWSYLEPFIEYVNEELASKEINDNFEKLPDSEKALGPILSRVLKAQSVFYIDYDRRSRAKPNDMVIVETSWFEILLPEKRLCVHEDEYDEVGMDLSPEDYGKRNKLFGWSLNKDELCPKPQDYNPTISVEKNLYGDGRDWFRATFEEFPNMIGGIGRTEEEAVKAGYSMLREELRWLIGEGLGFPLPRNEGCHD